MRRREFVAVIAGMATMPLTALAQQRTLPIVGFLDSRSAEAIGRLSKAATLKAKPLPPVLK